MLKRKNQKVGKNQKVERIENLIADQRMTSLNESFDYY